MTAVHSVTKVHNEPRASISLLHTSIKCMPEIKQPQTHSWMTDRQTDKACGSNFRLTLVTGRPCPLYNLYTRLSTSSTSVCISGNPVLWLSPAPPVMQLESLQYPPTILFKWIFISGNRIP